MQSRSWMAALALATAVIGAFASESIARESAPIKQKVQLTLVFDGLTTEGGDVEIKPSHAGSKFETIKFQTKSYHQAGNNVKVKLDPIEVETVSANGNCSFTITLKEPGQPDKTIRRNLRITPTAPGQPVKPQAMTCYISSNSLSAVASKPASETKTKK